MDPIRAGAGQRPQPRNREPRTPRDDTGRPRPVDLKQGNRGSNIPAHAPDTNDVFRQMIEDLR